MLIHQKGAYPTMLPSHRSTALLLAGAAGAITLIAPELLFAQEYYQANNAYTPGYTYQEASPTRDPLLFGVAAYKICQIKTFLFAGVYVLGAIAFVIFAIRALFTKFEMKHFIPILGALFIVASADLFIYWMSEDAYFCPTALSSFGG
jgi:hypothetical protein